MALCSFSGFAQKIGYIDTEEILNGIPEYQTAQQQLNELADKYKSVIEAEIGKIDVLYQSYQNQKAALSESQRQVKENEIIEKEKAVKEKQKIYFGEEGIMASKSEELLTPIKNKVQSAIDAVSSKEGYSLVLDLAAMSGVVYKDTSLDLTQKVFKYLNISNNI